MPLPRSPKYVSGLRPTQESGSNPKDDLGMLKVPLGLISGPAEVLQAFCMQDGCEKYGPYNYRVAKVQALIYLEALLRHTRALIDGEDYDLLTGKPHIGYILATAQIYADAWINSFLIDNRPLPGRTGELMTMLNRTPNEPEPTPEQLIKRFQEFIATCPKPSNEEASDTASSQPSPVEAYASGGVIDSSGNVSVPVAELLKSEQTYLVRPLSPADSADVSFPDPSTPSAIELEKALDRDTFRIKPPPRL